MKKEAFTQLELLRVCDRLTAASMSTLDAESKIAVCMFRRRLQPLRRAADEAIADGRDRLAPEGWDEARQWLEEGSGATPQQRDRATEMLNDYNARIDDYACRCLSEEPLPEVKPLPLAVVKGLLDSNPEWSASEIDALLEVSEMEE